MSKTKEVILGIDPGSRVTGYAVLECDGGTHRSLVCGTLRTTHLDSQPDRLEYIFEEVSKILNQYQPTHCAIETPVYGKDPQAMLKLGRAQAASILAIQKRGLTVTEYYPKAVKKALTGNGNAGKQQVARMLLHTIEPGDQPLDDLPEDASDALAVAWCHHMKLKGLGAGSVHSSSADKRTKGAKGWKAFVENNPERIHKKS